jgi:hypothetical protein
MNPLPLTTPPLLTHTNILLFFGVAFVSPYHKPMAMQKTQNPQSHHAKGIQAHKDRLFVEGSRETPLLALAGIELPHKGHRLVPMNLPPTKRDTGTQRQIPKPAEQSQGCVCACAPLDAGCPSVHIACLSAKPMQKANCNQTQRSRRAM